MLKQLFYINDRFAVDPQLGTVNDTVAKRDTRLEPRIMHLLCLLAADVDQLVSREYLVKTVWDDYGSADEGLTQAVSYLRKVFNDQEKTLIETVPKKGYVLHAVISQRQVQKRIKPWFWAIAAAALLLLLAYFILIRPPRSAYSPDVVGGSTHTEQPNKDHPDTVSKKSGDLK